MKLTDIGGRAYVMRDSRGIWWLAVGDRVRWATNRQEIFAMAETMKGHGR